MRGSREFMVEDAPALEVTCLEGFGIGPVTPTGRYTDSEVAQEVARTQESVQDPTIVCIDERHAAGSPEPVRRKTAGGAGMSGFEGAILADWHLLGNNQEADQDSWLQKGANTIFDFVAEVMVERGIKLGGHEDNHPEPGKTHCGAADGAPAANARLAEIGHTEIEPIVSAVMGEDFDAAIYAEVIKQAQRLEEVKFFKNWNPVAAHERVKKLGGIIEILDAKDVIIGDGSDEKRHGHGAEAIKKGTEPSKSSNRDVTNIRYFQLDKSAVDEIANVLGRNEYEAKVIATGIYAYNLSVAYGLTSDQRYL